MDIRQYFTTRKLLLAALIIGCAFPAQVFAQKAAINATAKHPNIIFILVDDQGYGDLGAFFQNQRAKEGKPHERSPNLDKLAAGGAILTQHYAAAPVCAPSRASIMLGVSQGHSNVRNNEFDKAIADNYTMASTLRSLGYSTAAIGKWGLQGDKRWDPDGASWPARPRNRGFDYFFGYMRHSDGHEHYPKEGLYSGKKQVWDNGANIASELDKCYTADLWTAVAKKWIIDHEKGKSRDKPFFMYLAYETPHAVDELPTQQYPAGGGLTGGMQWTGTPGHMINTASGTPDSYINPDYAHATYDNDNNPATPQVPWPDTYKRYATANRRIDYGVGDLVQLLKDLKIDSTTLIVYTSDNGPSIETYLKKEKWEEKHLPTFFSSYGPFDGIKRDDWEGGVRMATIASWPGSIPAGEVVTTPGISYDWAPTFIDAAGEPAPARMDGVSLLPSLTGKGKQRPALIYMEYYHAGKTPSFNSFVPAHRGRRRGQMQSIRLGDYMGVRYNIQSASDSFEIYNVVKDPQERFNLALKPKKKVVIEGLRSWNTGRINIGRLETYMKTRVLQVRRPDSAAPRPYDSALVPPVQAVVVPGLEWNLYRGDFPWIPQAATLHPDASGHAPRPDAGVGKGNRGLLYFDGYIRVPVDGNYTFYLTSDTRAFLRIHDAQLIDEDFGYHSGTQKKASILLKAGLHPFRLYDALEDTGEPSVRIQWSGPGLSKREVPAKVFFHDKKKR
jgi:arylsulfatase A-like enzyme